MCEYYEFQSITNLDQIKLIILLIFHNIHLNLDSKSLENSNATSNEKIYPIDILILSVRKKHKIIDIKFIDECYSFNNIVKFMYEMHSLESTIYPKLVPDHLDNYAILLQL